MREPSREEDSQTNFVVASVFSPLFQVYFEASNATGIYKHMYECTTHAPGLSSALLARCFNFSKIRTAGVLKLILAEDRYGAIFTNYWNVLDYSSAINHN